MSGGKKNEAARRKLELWQHRLAIAQRAWAAERGKMDRREQLYRGSHDIYQPDGKLAKAKATHVRNMSSPSSACCGRTGTSSGRSMTGSGTPS